jgi:cytochrome c peroxidase
MITKLQGLSYYNTLFTFAYGDNTVTKNRVEKALAQFLRSIQSYDSKFDAGMQATGDHLAPFPNFTAAENAGKALFSTDAIKSGGQRTGGGTGCFHCHNPVNFHFIVEKKNNGVTTEIDGSTVLNITKAPSLRDVFNPLGQLNGPLFHNGQATNFSALLSNYNTISPNANLDIRMTINGDLNLTTLERSQLQAFIKTLSGSDIYTNPRWSDPFDADGSITVSTATGIVDYTRYKVKAYPTLAHDFVTIDGLPDNGGQALNVISAEGRSVISGAIWGGERIDVSALPAGFYTILITNEKSQLVLSQKIIKN